MVSFTPGDETEADAANPAFREENVENRSLLNDRDAVSFSSSRRSVVSAPS